MQNSGFVRKYIYSGYVVFSDSTGLWWLRFLKKGFKHCYLIVRIQNNPDIWLEINPMSNQVYFFEYSTVFDINYIKHLQKDKGMTLVPVEFNQAPLKCAPIGVFTCVELIKRVLGIHKFFLFTPHQLYKFLTNNQK